MVATINPDASRIPDEAEVWIQSKADVDAAGGIDNVAVAPTSSDEDLSSKGWGYVGLIDAKKGVAFDPSGDFKAYDAFGHTQYRSKFSKGKLDTGFTVLEYNGVTAGIILPGSADDMIGPPRDLQFYVAIRVVDEGFTDELLVSRRPATLELKSHSGYVEGEQTMYEFVAHHSADANKDVFKIIGGDVNAAEQWTLTLDATGGNITLGHDGNPTGTIAVSGISSSSIKSALVALDDGYKASNWTVTGSSSPFTITLPKRGVLTVDASAATGGTAAVAPV